MATLFHRAAIMKKAQTRRQKYVWKTLLLLCLEYYYYYGTTTTTTTTTNNNNNNNIIIIYYHIFSLKQQQQTLETALLRFLFAPKVLSIKYDRCSLFIARRCTLFIALDRRCRRGNQNFTDCHCQQSRSLELVLHNFLGNSVRFLYNSWFLVLLEIPHSRSHRPL